MLVTREERAPTARPAKEVVREPRSLSKGSSKTSRRRSRSSKWSRCLNLTASIREPMGQNRANDSDQALRVVRLDGCTSQPDGKNDEPRRSSPPHERPVSAHLGRRLESQGSTTWGGPAEWLTDRQPIRRGVIGSTSDFGSESSGSSPGDGAGIITIRPGSNQPPHSTRVRFSPSFAPNGRKMTRYDVSANQRGRAVRQAHGQHAPMGEVL
jgi:hypothetical protein